MTVEPGAKCVLRDPGASGWITVQGSGRIGKLALQTPVMIHFGEEPWDEVFITHEAACAGVEIENTGCEPLVGLRYFGPDVHQEHAEDRGSRGSTVDRERPPECRDCDETRKRVLRIRIRGSRGRSVGDLRGILDALGEYHLRHTYDEGTLEMRRVLYGVTLGRLPETPGRHSRPLLAAYL